MLQVLLDVLLVFKPPRTFRAFRLRLCPMDVILVSLQVTGTNKDLRTVRADVKPGFAMDQLHMSDEHRHLTEGVCTLLTSMTAGSMHRLGVSVKLPCLLECL